MKLLGLNLTVLVVFTLMVVLGCGNTNEHHAYLEVTFKNASNERINEAAVRFGKYRCTAGTIIPGVGATHLDWRPPVGTNAIVEWRDSKQAKQEALVSLAGIYDPTVEGRLIFSVGPTNVTVSFKRR